jgi:hypothetical protein
MREEEEKLSIERKKPYLGNVYIYIILEMFKKSSTEIHRKLSNMSGSKLTAEDKEEN